MPGDWPHSILRQSICPVWALWYYLHHMAVVIHQTNYLSTTVLPCLIRDWPTGWQGILPLVYSQTEHLWISDNVEPCWSMLYVPPSESSGSNGKRNYCRIVHCSTTGQQETFAVTFTVMWFFFFAYPSWDQNAGWAVTQQQWNSGGYGSCSRTQQWKLVDDGIYCHMSFW